MVAFAMVAVCGFLNWGGNAETADTISFQMTAYEATGVKDWFLLIAGGISVMNVDVFGLRIYVNYRRGDRRSTGNP